MGYAISCRYCEWQGKEKRKHMWSPKGKIKEPIEPTKAGLKHEEKQWDYGQRVRYQWQSKSNTNEVKGNGKKDAMHRTKPIYIMKPYKTNVLQIVCLCFF